MGELMRISRLLVLLTLLSFELHARGPMTNEDREHLVAHLQMTQSWLADEVSSLSVEQLNYRMAPGKWTILEVVEHLTIAEPGYWQSFQAAMKKPASKLPKEPADADILWYGIDRTERQKTVKSEEPKGQLTDVRDGLARFQHLHATMLEYARTTDDDLRGHVLSEWNMDAYQGLLMISTHEQRHILQIREIKADPGYPKGGDSARTAPRSSK